MANGRRRTWAGRSVSGLNLNVGTTPWHVQVVWSTLQDGGGTVIATEVLLRADPVPDSGQPASDGALRDGKCNPSDWHYFYDPVRAIYSTGLPSRGTTNIPNGGVIYAPANLSIPQTSNTSLPYLVPGPHLLMLRYSGTGSGQVAVVGNHGYAGEPYYFLAAAATSEAAQWNGLIWVANYQPALDLQGGSSGTLGVSLTRVPVL